MSNDHWFPSDEPGPYIFIIIYIYIYIYIYLYIYIYRCIYVGAISVFIY